MQAVEILPAFYSLQITNFTTYHLFMAHNTKSPKKTTVAATQKKLQIEAATAQAALVGEELKNLTALLSSNIVAQLEAIAEYENKVNEAQQLHAARTEELDNEYAQKVAELEADFEHRTKLGQSTLDATLANLSEARRTATLDVQLAIKEDKAKALNDLAKEAGKVLLDKKEADVLKADIDSVNNTWAAKLERSLADMKEIHAIELQAEAKRLTYEFTAKSAQMEAQLESLKAQLLAAKEENTRLIKQFDDLRTSMVAMQQAAAQSAVNVYTGADKK
jgi:hypothetical protein